EEEKPPRVLDGALGARNRAQEIEGRLEHGAERLTSVLVREGELAADHQELPLTGVDHLAAQHLFDRLRRGPLRAPGLDAADDTTEILERVGGHRAPAGQRA